MKNKSPPILWLMPENPTIRSSFQQFKILNHGINKGAIWSKTIFNNDISCPDQCKWVFLPYQSKTVKALLEACKSQRTHSVPRDKLERASLAWGVSHDRFVEQICGLRGLSETTTTTTTIQHLPQFALFPLSLEEQICTESPPSGPHNCKTPSTTVLALTDNDFHSPALAAPGCVCGQLIPGPPPYA